MKPRIKQHLTVRVFDESELVFSGGQGYQSVDLTPPIQLLFDLMDGNRSIGEICNLMQIHFPEVTESEVFEALRELRAANIVEDLLANPVMLELSRYQQERYSRQLLYFSALEIDGSTRVQMQTRLQGASVTVLGTGGVGSHTALHLTCMGIGRVRLVDFDRVELSNLNRSFIFSDSDVGSSKVRTVGSFLRELNRDITVEEVELKITCREDIEMAIEGSDFAVLCADMPYLDINEWFNSACLYLGIPFSLAGASGTLGTVGPITVPFESSCFECQDYDKTSLTSGPNFLLDANARRQAASFVPVIGMLAAINVLEISKYLSGWSIPSLINRQLKCDFIDLEFSFNELPRKPDCMACGDGDS